LLLCQFQLMHRRGMTQESCSFQILLSYYQYYILKYGTLGKEKQVVGMVRNWSVVSKCDNTEFSYKFKVLLFCWMLGAGRRSYQ
jgi:hypothetical protein